MLHGASSATPAAPPSLSGVEQLNNTLAHIVTRVNRVAERIGVLANQFGAPATEANPDPVKSPTTTNEFMIVLDCSLTSLERIVSRIDNQNS